jgi:hypothetical protein
MALHDPPQLQGLEGNSLSLFVYGKDYDKKRKEEDTDLER